MLRSFLVFVGSLLLALPAARLTLERVSPDIAGRILTILSLAAVLGVALIRALRSRTQLTPTRRDTDRIVNSCLAIAVGWAAIATAAYAGTALGIAASATFLEDFLFLIPFLPLLISGYVALTARVEGEDEDSLCRFGALLRGRGQWQWPQHKELLLGLLVKAFFVPLMYGNLVIANSQLVELAVPTTYGAVTWFLAFGLSIDLLVATAGYLSTSKLFGGSIIRVDDSWLSWAACLICYAPFFQYVRMLTEQRDSLIWTAWLQPDQPLYWVWGGLIVGSWSMYWLSSLAFGLRFSNLTYRGLVDRGPYRYFKHPAYLFKNIYWWLLTVPLFGIQSALDGAVNVLGLSVVSAIYYVRAKSEERFLEQFEEYAAYARRLETASLVFRIRERLKAWATA